MTSRASSAPSASAALSDAAESGVRRADENSGLAPLILNGAAICSSEAVPTCRRSAASVASSPESTVGGGSSNNERKRRTSASAESDERNDHPGKFRRTRSL